MEMSDATSDAEGDRALVGTWDLTAFESRTGEDEVVHPLGPDPVGRLVYTDDGFVSVLVAGGDRPPFASADPRGGSDAEIVQAFRSFVAYSGTYRVEGDVVVHDVDVSLLPNWVGDTQRRLVALDGDE